jgi:hypothetical protein
MKKYTVKFEIFGKKMQTIIEAENQFRADIKLRERLKVYSIDEIKGPVIDKLKQMFGM